jgi:hypothetical protein
MWKEMLRTLTTPISSRAPSALSSTAHNDTFIPINNNQGVDVNYSADKEDNKDEIDSEISEEDELVNIHKRKDNKQQSPRYKSKRRRTGGKTKKRINKQKNKKTKKQKIKKQRNKKQKK